MKKLKLALCITSLVATFNTANSLEVSVSNSGQNSAGYEARINSLLAEIEALRALVTTNTNNLNNKIEANKNSITNNTTVTNKHYKQIQSNTTRITNLEKKVNTTVTTPATPSKMYWRPTGEVKKGRCLKYTSYPQGKYITIGSQCHVQNERAYYDKHSQRCGSDKDRSNVRIAACQ